MALFIFRFFKNMFVSVFLLQKQYMVKGIKKKIKKGVTESHLSSFQTIITGLYHFNLNFYLCIWFLKVYTVVAVVQLLICVWLYATPWTEVRQASLSFTISQSLLKFISIGLDMPSNHLILCPPRLLLPPVFPCIRVFSSELTLHQVAKVLKLQLQHQAFQWIFRVDFLWIDCFDLLEVQGTQEFESINSLALSLLCGTTLTHVHDYCKHIASPKWTFVGKVMSLFFNTQSRFVTAFLPRSTCLFMAAVTICSDFGAQENKICHFFHFFSFYLPWSDRARFYGLSFVNVEF